MKNLFLITEDERNRILNLHETATKRQYLNEDSNTGGCDTITLPPNWLETAAKTAEQQMDILEGNIIQDTNPTNVGTGTGIWDSISERVKYLLGIVRYLDKQKITYDGNCVLAMNAFRTEYNKHSGKFLGIRLISKDKSSFDNEINDLLNSWGFKGRVWMSLSDTLDDVKKDLLEIQNILKTNITIPEHNQMLNLTLTQQPQQPQQYSYTDGKGEFSMVPPQQNSGNASTENTKKPPANRPKQVTPQPSDLDLDNYLNQQ